MKKTGQAVGRTTLTGVQRQFSLWRQTRKAGEKIPPELWAAAARLTEENSLHKVSRTLRLNHTDLKRHAAQAGQPAVVALERVPAFMELGIPGPRHSERTYTVELEDAGGRKLRICVNGAQRGEVLELIRQMWAP